EAQRKQKDNGTNEDNVKQSSQPESSVAQTPSPLAETGASPSIPDNGADTLKSKDKVVGDIQSKENNKGSEQKDGGGGTVNQKNPQTDSNSHTPAGGTNQGGESRDRLTGGSDSNQGPQKTVDSPVVKSKNCVIKVKGNETTGIGDIYVPKEYKQVGILIIVILIPITLAIMYKYLASGRKKELKRKKNMKKVINLMEGKRHMQIIIKSSNGGGGTVNQKNPQTDSNSHTPAGGTNQGGESRDRLTGGSDSNQGPQKTVDSPVVKSKNCVIKVKGNETTGIGDIYVPKEYKQVGILIIVILIPITLAIMYKYLASGRKKELKRKKNMKKVINLMEGKRHMQIIIKSSSQKKQTKKSINPVYGEKSPSINIYKLMQA
ncbi:hypothetical protein PCHDK_000508000, partial [Plasmodium chabaudi adami]